MTLNQDEVRQVYYRSIPAEAAGCRDRTLYQSAPCSVVSTAEREKMTAKHRKHLNLRDDWIWIKQGEPWWKLLQYITLIVGTAFCNDQFSCGFIMCLLPLSKSLWPDPGAFCVLFQLNSCFSLLEFWPHRAAGQAGTTHINKVLFSEASLKWLLGGQGTPSHE